MLYPAKLSFRIKGQIKCFPEKKKLKEFISSNQYYIKCYRKEKKIKNTNNKIAINTYLSATESKKQNK